MIFVFKFWRNAWSKCCFIAIGLWKNKNNIIPPWCETQCGINQKQRFGFFPIFFLERNFYTLLVRLFVPKRNLLMLFVPLMFQNGNFNITCSALCSGTDLLHVICSTEVVTKNWFRVGCCKLYLFVWHELTFIVYFKDWNSYLTTT